MEFRIERDLIGEVQVPKDAYYGVHTQRALNNFNLSGVKLYMFPELIKSFAYVKWAAAAANVEVGVLDKKIADAIIEACKKLIAGEYLDQFPSDMLQGGAGTSTNMNVNEVIANIALEILGHKKSEYKYCSPYDHVNLSQSTNDAYPTSVKLAAYFNDKTVEEALSKLSASFHKKGDEFYPVLTMGRTHLQDAVPLRLGQEFEAWSVTLRKEIPNFQRCSENLLEINMGATAVGTGLNAKKGYDKACTRILSEITGFKFQEAENLVEATSNTGSFVAYSGAMKQLAVKMSKIANDIRLLASGPRTGLFEINLPPRQAGSSIMPGKVNPVIPEVVNQTCFRIIGNDLTLTLASEGGQLQLNVMEPVMTYMMLESQHLIVNAMNCFRENCIDGITANEKHCYEKVVGSVGIVTALNPYIGYVKSTELAQQALRENRSVADLALEQKLLTKEQIDEIFSTKGLLGEL